MDVPLPYGWLRIIPKIAVKPDVALKKFVIIPRGKKRCVYSGIRDQHVYYYPLVMTNIAMVQMAHRNRWFTWVYL
jgi:hypothetical protein